MGPYRSLDSATVADGTEAVFYPSEIEMREHLMMLRDVVRNAGFNAVIATDIGIPGREMDFAEQSVRFAKASNAVAFIVPHLAKNEGVCIEIGNVLTELSSSHQKRTKIFLEVDVDTAMLGNYGNGWEVASGTFEERSELRRKISQFVTNVELEERKGNLKPRDELRW